MLQKLAIAAEDAKKLKRKLLGRSLWQRTLTLEELARSLHEMDLAGSQESGRQLAPELVQYCKRHGNIPYGSSFLLSPIYLRFKEEKDASGIKYSVDTTEDSGLH